MSLLVACPTCTRQAKVSDAAAGKQVRCRCGAVFTVAASAPSQEEAELQPAEPANAETRNLQNIASEVRPPKRGRNARTVPNAPANPKSNPAQAVVKVAVGGLFVLVLLALIVGIAMDPGRKPKGTSNMAPAPSTSTTQEAAINFVNLWVQQGQEAAAATMDDREPAGQKSFRTLGHTSLKNFDGKVIKTQMTAPYTLRETGTQIQCDVIRVTPVVAKDGLSSPESFDLWIFTDSKRVFIVEPK